MISTPHINLISDTGFSDVVLMPGDPKRAKYIAENYLHDIKLVNDTLGVNGYSGFYNNRFVSVMASGMGIPSISIYSYELYNYFGVDTIIRVGSAGSYKRDFDIGNIILAQGACTDSNIANILNVPGVYSAICDYNVLETAVEVSKSLKVDYAVGNILSTDSFYDSDCKLWANLGVLAVDMESYALYLNSARFNKKALTICTVSDNLITDNHLSAKSREESFSDMITVALMTAERI